MENILNTILSENWIIALLFVLTLIWVYKFTKWFWEKYFKALENYHEIKLKAENEKNISFLKAVSDIVEQVRAGDWMHTEEHKTINNNLIDWHAKIHIKLDDIHKDIISNKK